MIPLTRYFYCTLMRLCRAALYTVLVVSSTAYATSVVEVTLEEMLQNSALVFEGRVIDVKVHENANRVIHTQITFEIDDVIKGEVKGRKITLGFLGGELADRKLSIAEMQMPVLHERGIYFVESPTRKQVNPLYGWSQGHLRIEQDPAGTERVFTGSGRPVMGVEHTNCKRSGRLSKGVARGLMVGTPDEVSAALDKKEFKRLLRAAQ